MYIKLYFIERNAFNLLFASKRKKCLVIYIILHLCSYIIMYLLQFIVEIILKYTLEGDG